MENNSLKKIDVAGLKLNTATKQEVLAVIAERVSAKQKTFVVTPYSEFLYASLRQSRIRELLNKADISITDGIGVLWAHYFLTQPFSFKSYYLKILQAWMQVVWTGATILLRPSVLYRDIPEKIVGADFAWDLAELAEKHGFSIYILGGFGNTDKQVAQKFRAKFPNIKIAGTSNKMHNDPSIFSDIIKANPDMLLVGLGPIVQEQWIVDNLPSLPTSFAIGLGGTFDYIAGARRKPPQFIRANGLEWLYRLITQPSRVRRIINATWGLTLALVRYKVHVSTPLRRNGCAVVINEEGKILVCKRTPGPAKNGVNPGVVLSDYWQFPQGGLDESETVEAGATRELQEETGIVSVKVIGEAKYRNTYEWNNGSRALVGTGARKKYRHRGQDQITIFFKFVGEDSEIKLDQDELIDYKWVSPSEVVNVLAPERRPHAEAVLAELVEIQL